MLIEKTADREQSPRRSAPGVATVAGTIVLAQPPLEIRRVAQIDFFGPQTHQHIEPDPGEAAPGHGAGRLTPGAAT